MKNIPSWIKNQFFYTLAVSSTMLSNIFISVISANFLRVSEYGFIALLKPTIVISTSFFGLGLSQAFNHWRWREGINKGKLIETTLGGIFIASILLSIILFCFLAILLNDRNELISIHGYLSILILSISYMQNTEMLNLYRVDNLKKKYAFAVFARSLLQIISITSIIFINRKYTSYIYGLTISEMIMFSFLLKDIGFLLGHE